jgi:hypothetical protein
MAERTPEKTPAHAREDAGQRGQRQRGRVPAEERLEEVGPGPPASATLARAGRSRLPMPPVLPVVTFELDQLVVEPEQ